MAVETAEYLDMLERLIRRAGVRVGDADEPELERLVGMRDVLEKSIETAIAGQRSIGRSWDAIAAGTGHKSRQAAWKRYHHLDEETPAGGSE